MAMVTSETGANSTEVTRMVTDVTTRMATDFTNTSFMTLQQLNDAEFYRRLAPVIYLVILMVIGIPGNLLVLAVYFRSFSGSTHRTFILSLAAVDLVICLVSLPFEILEMRFQYTFYNVIACKIFRANNNFLSLGSIFTIVCMSIDRYKRVCRPLRPQMTKRVSLFSCLGCLVVSFLFALPNFAISGIRKVTLKYNITGSNCSLSDQFAKTIYPIAYGGVLFIIFLIVIVLLIVVYSLIARKIYKHSKFRERFQSSTYSGSLTQTSSISNHSRNQISEKNGNKEMSLQEVKFVMTSSSETQESETTSSNGTTKLGTDETEVTSPATQPEVTKSTTKNLDRSIKKSPTIPHADRKRTAKITRISFTISLVFVLSYLPHLVLSLMTAVKGGFVAKPGPIVSAVLPIVTRSIFINNVANPIIYGFLDPKFRQSCKDGFKAVLHTR